MSAWRLHPDALTPDSLGKDSVSGPFLKSLLFIGDTSGAASKLAIIQNTAWTGRK